MNQDGVTLPTAPDPSKANPKDLLQQIGQLNQQLIRERQESTRRLTESQAKCKGEMDRLRQIAATVPGKEALMKQSSGELESREKGMLKAETSAQAQAQLQELLHKVGASNGVDIRGVEDMRIKPFGSDYGEASVTVRFTCLIEQLVNLLAALAVRPELISTSDLRITSSNSKEKVVGVRLGVIGVVPRRLVPEKKGGSA
jgi:small-conductance mechanosensitive channel